MILRRYTKRGDGNCTRYLKKSAHWFRNRTQTLGTEFAGATSRWSGNVEACAAVTQSPPPRMPTVKPNLVFILSDDWGWADASWHRDAGYAKLLLFVFPVVWFNRTETKRFLHGWQF